MTSTISSLPNPVPPRSSSAANGMNGISGLTSIGSQSEKVASHSSGINSSAGLASYRNGKSSTGINGGTGQANSSHITPPTLNEPIAEGSDSEAETVVLSQSRGRSRSNRSKYPDQNSNDGDDDLLGGSSYSKKTNGDSKGRPDKEDEDYSSELSSTTSSRAASSASKRPSAKDQTRKRTASPSRLTHSPPRRKIQKLHEDEVEKRRSLKRKARDVSPERSEKTHGRSPNRGVRIQSSPPMSPPPPPTSESRNGARSTKDKHSATNSSSEPPSHRHGHTRTRSVQSAGPSKTPGPKPKTKRPGRPAPLHFNDRSDNEKSSSSSRSTSPQQLPSRRRRPSFSAAAASPARLVPPGHRMKRDKTGRNQLHKICAKGELDEAKTCLKQEPELLNDADNAGYLPIHAAALAGHDDIVGWLIDEGSLVDKPAHSDLSTPLQDAVENMHVEVVNILLEHGADPRHRNTQGQSSLDIAHDIKQQNDDPEEAAKIAQIQESLKAALTKLRNKKKVDDEARKGNESSSSRAASVTSPSHLSPPPQSNPASGNRRRTGRWEPTRNEFLWLDAGKGGQAKLKNASRDGDMGMAARLLESGIIPDPESVMLAARGGHLDVLNFLIAFGGDSDPDPKDVIRQHTKDKSTIPLATGEETPILATIGRNNIEVLKLLLRSETMKEPRRLDSKGRSYADIAKQRAGENWEEEVKLLQKAWDDAGPQKSSKSSREKLESSPVASRKDKEKDKNHEKERKSERKEIKVEKSEEPKKTKRLRRRSASGAPSSIMDDTAPSEREISPAIHRSKVKDGEKQKRKDRAVESDYSAISDSNATVDGAKAKKRRLVLGKDLASKSEKIEKSKDEKSKEDKASSLSSRKKTETTTGNDIEMDHVPKRKKEKAAPPPEDEDIDMVDAPKPKKRVSELERQSKREQSLEGISKRHRDSSSSSHKAAVNNEHNSDADAHISSKKRRKMEDDVETPKVKLKEERQSDADVRPKTKEERLAERENRRNEANKAEKLKLKAERLDKPMAEVSGKDSDEILERKKEKRKKREEAAALAAKEAESAPVRRAKEREAPSSDLESKKVRTEKERSSHGKEKEKEKEREKEKDKDAMDIDTDGQSSKRGSRKHSGDAPSDETGKMKKRRSNGASPAPSLSDDKNGTRHLTDLSNGKSNRGSSLRDEVKPEVKPKVEPNDDDAMLTEERELELQRQRQEQEKKKQEAKLQEEKRRAEEEERTEKEKIAETIRAQELLKKQKEEEERKRYMEKMRELGVALISSASLLSDGSRSQAIAQHSIDQARHDELMKTNSLPHIFREAVTASDKTIYAKKLSENFGSLLPLYVVQAGDQPEHWISNAQACLILGCGHDLQMTKFADLPRRPVSASEKQALGRNLHPMYSCFQMDTEMDLEFDVRMESKRQELERAKFDALDGLFWLKVTDLYSILNSDKCFKPIVDKFMRRGRLPVTTLCVDDN